MLLAVRESLPFAVGLVLVAAPLLTISLVLATGAPRRVSAMFVAGWAAGIVTAAGLIVAFVDISAPRGLPAATLAIIRIALGVTLSFLAVRAGMQEFRMSQRRCAGACEPAQKPGSKLANWSALRAFTIGCSLSAINPKNLAPTAAGAAAILETSSNPLEQAVAILVFAAVASVGIATPSLLQAMGGTATREALDRAAQWMMRHAKKLSVIVLAALAVALLVKGFAAASIS